jgi:hypothetical protein
VVLGGAACIELGLAPLLQHTDPRMSPFTAWVVLKSLETQPGVPLVRHRWLAIHPATAEHLCIRAKKRSRTGITDGAIRVSVGLQNVENLHDDLAAALASR